MLAALLTNLARRSPAGGRSKTAREKQERLEMLIDLFDCRIPEKQRKEVSRKVSQQAKEVRAIVAEVAPELEHDFFVGIAQVQVLVATSVAPDPWLLVSLANDLIRIRLAVEALIDEEDAILALLLS